MSVKLWCFGDSFTERYNQNVDWCKQYINFKGYYPKVYCDFIGDNLNVESENLGEGGSDNYTIFGAICKNVHRIKENDIVIIGWSSVIRFRLANKNGGWVKFIPEMITDYHISHHTNVLRSTVEDILINRDNQVFYNEVNGWIHFINTTLKNNKVIHWTPFRDNDRLNVYKFEEFQTIKMETKIINDNHYSENGHKKLSTILTNLLSKNLI